MSYQHYLEHNRDNRVMIKSTGEHGEAWESALGFTSVFIDGEQKCRIFKDDDILYLEDTGVK